MKKWRRRGLREFVLDLVLEVGVGVCLLELELSFG